MTLLGLRIFRCRRKLRRKQWLAGVLLAISTFLITQVIKEASRSKTSASSVVEESRHHQVDHAKRQQDRLQSIREYCKNSKNNSDIVHTFPLQRNLFNFVVSEKYKFIICYVPKTGASQWKRALINILANHSVQSDPDTISLFDYDIFTFLNKYNPRKRQAMLKTYAAFFFVREPFERLLSAFRDKFETYTTSLYSQLGREIVGKLRKSSESKNSNKLPSFDEFTEYLSTLPDNLQWDMHWRPIHQVCYPCAIDYDYVGHFETVKEDADYILQQLKLDKMAEFPSFSGSNTSKRLTKYYSQIPRKRIEKLIEIYRPDFDMFNYDFPDEIMALLNDRP
ncbi:carbohydrate sulfotransferase 11-like [Acropora muricata]|uniref:carbohydrate sulfotransferase 11-like n=1 Tax=Acropora muricata TaxID=159855 RepID=UPI0034E3830D